ncbi:MAG: methionyl aminopeptidase [Victivallaceae bacterium]
MIKKNDPCWCLSGKKWKNCHYPFLHDLSSEEQIKREYASKYDILIKSKTEISKIRTACRVTAKILNKICNYAKAGITTDELNDLSIDLHKQFNAIPAPLGYGTPPFPKTICTSLNEVICHGIPNNVPLKSGDILNIDVSCIVDGYYGDCSKMVLIDTVSQEKQDVCSASLEALEEAIKILKPGLPLYEIGNIIENVAARYGFTVVDQFVGHGVGIRFHEGPQVFHHHNQSNIPLVPGMTFTIEPMINVGVNKGSIDPSNQWEARTLDGKPSAQWEHTVLITYSGYEILTLPEE